jgi:hypothetical protein
MRKKIIIAIWIIFFLLASSFMDLQANTLRYANNTSLINADASFRGGSTSKTGEAVRILGDVNGDGYDDILFSASSSPLKVYLFFGKDTGLTKDTPIANANASFIGFSELYDQYSIDDAGDINGDGYHDIIFGDYFKNQAGYRSGMCYIIFGRPNGWSQNMDISSKANASFIGEAAGDHAGFAVAGIGDVNGDGLDDILISAPSKNSTLKVNGEIYLIFGKSSGWATDVSLNTANASFIGENNNNAVGYSIAGAGDVNGDGLDDFIIGTYINQTYLIFGKRMGWTKDLNLSNADASFIGEAANDHAGSALAGAGDVNNDGYDDFLIGAPGNDETGSDAGKSYLILGKSSGWANDVELTNSDASFRGEMASYQSGFSVSGEGDVNGDGFDDFLIGAPFKNPGKAYLILGRASGWTNDIDLPNSNASFVGVGSFAARAGYSVSNSGDVNGDGYDDILIGDPTNQVAIPGSDHVYLLFADLNKPPTIISSINAYEKGDYINTIGSAGINDTVFIELKATDADSSHTDMALVSVTSNASSPKGFTLKLIETGPNTGVYHGSFTIRNVTHENHKWINASIGELIIITSIKDPTKSCSIYVSGLRLLPISDIKSINEDEKYSVHYWSFGDPVSQWDFHTNSSWLQWDTLNHNVTGIPDNGDVGSYWVNVRITGVSGDFDEHKFTLKVVNTPPIITTADVTSILQDKTYSVDYNSTDDGQGIVTWHLKTNASWLHLNSISGVLNGTPSNALVGKYWVNISIDDGNGGWDWSNFTLKVVNKNDPPVIITKDQTTAVEDELYSVNYAAMDIDVGDRVATWTFASNATSWLTFNASSQLLAGTPSNDNVGYYWVNITARDLNGGMDFHNFTLTVQNVNDPPEILSTPVLDVTVLYRYQYQILAKDIDRGDVLSISLKKSPTNMMIDGTGMVNWMPTKDQRGLNPVIIQVSDNNGTLEQSFNVTVTVPQTNLVFPKNNAIVTTLKPELTWAFPYPSNPNIAYDLYLGKEKNPPLLMSGIKRLNYSLQTALTENVTYYWYVTPRNGSINSDVSPVWSFKANLGGVIVSKYDVRLELDREVISAHRGDVLRLNMTITNIGNLDGFVDITMKTNLPSSMFDYISNISLATSNSKVIGVNITIPKDFNYGDYNVSITAKLGNATSTKGLTITVIKPIAPGKTIPIWQEPAFWLLIILVIAISVILVVYTVYRRRKTEAARIRAEKELEETKVQAAMEVKATKIQAEQEIEAVKKAAEEVEDFAIDEVFLIYQDGRLIAHVAPKESGMDDQIFGSMLIAVQSFVKDSFQSEEGLTSFAFGSRKIILEKGNFLFLVVALSGTEPKIMKGQLHELVNKIEGLYAGIVENWDGNVDGLKDIQYYLTPIFGIKEGLRIKPEREEVKVLSGVEFFSGYVRLKVAVKNELSTAIKEVAFTLYFDPKILRLNHIEPQYQLYGSTVLFDNIDRDEKRTVAFYLDPIICQESNVDGKLTFKDTYDHPGEVDMKRRPVDIVCPIFYTPETMNVAMLKRLLETLKYHDSKIYQVNGRSGLEHSYKLAVETVGSYDVKFIREFREEAPLQVESWFYGEVKETSEKIVVMVAGAESTQYLQIYVASSNLASMTGFLAEAGSRFRTQLKKQSNIKTGLNPVTDESIKEEVERSAMLLDKYAHEETSPPIDK